MRYILILLVMLFANVSQAMNCQKLPDCASLGYSKGEDLNCVEDGYLNCPFDQDYKVCVQYNCAALGFTESDKTSWCADLIKCKGNSQMTLCQKPCLATTAQELKDLASSGKCKIVTMKNDINLPQDMTLTLAESTTIDGGGHGLTFNISGTKSGLFAFQLTKNSGLENINVHYNQTGNAHKFDFVRGDGSLHHVRFDGGAPAWQGNQHGVLFYDARVTVSGRFEVNFQDQGRSNRLSEYSYVNFINAQVTIKQTGTNRDGFAGGTIKFEDSDVTIDSDEFLIETTNAIFENTKFNFKGNGDIVWSESSHTSKLTLNQNADVSFTLKMPSNRPKLEVILSGTSGEPARLEINAPEMTNTNVRAMNVYDTLVLNNITCHPKQADTTLLSEILTSDNWTCDQ